MHLSLLQNPNDSSETLDGIWYFLFESQQHKLVEIRINNEDSSPELALICLKVK